MYYFDGKSGFITVITGPMFSEKSGELIRRCEKLSNYANKKVIAYKPDNDNRFAIDEIVSRMGYRLPAINLSRKIDDKIMEKVLLETQYADVVAFDEVQFFSKNIMALATELAYRKKLVIIAGLNLDYRGKEFGFIGGLLAMADEPVKLTAFCSCCARPASHTQRIVNGKPAKLGPIVIVGDKEAYEPRCRNCFIPPEKA